MNMDGPCMLDQGDVSIEDIQDELCPDCEERPITKYVQIDFRNAGSAHVIAELCGSCAVEMARRVRESLPKRTPERRAG